MNYGAHSIKILTSNFHREVKEFPEVFALLTYDKGLIFILKIIFCRFRLVPAILAAQVSVGYTNMEMKCLLYEMMIFYANERGH